MTDWTVHAARLADELTDSGKLWSTPWQAAVRAVPRHELVPVQYQRTPGTNQWVSTGTTDDLHLMYSNTALFVLPDGLSSTSMPALMTRMLEALDVYDGYDVLEIGTGTGYNAALLSHRLGDQHVFSVDIEPTLIRSARERLARIGYHPTLVTADGANGLPEHAPYDRIIATCSVPAVPWSWVEQPPGTAPLPAHVTAPSTPPGDGSTPCCGFSGTSTYRPASPSDCAARTPPDHLPPHSSPQPTAPGARSTNHPPTAPARSGKPDPTICGTSSKTHRKPGALWANQGGNASG
ncbi:MAG: methyltransferase domain-containing protein [Pseudonocardiaceae bacterium]